MSRMHIQSIWQTNASHPNRRAFAECVREVAGFGLEMILDGQAFILHVAVVLPICEQGSWHDASASAGNASAPSVSSAIKEKWTTNNGSQRVVTAGFWLQEAATKVLHHFCFLTLPSSQMIVQARAMEVNSTREGEERRGEEARGRQPAARGDISTTKTRSRSPRDGIQ